MTQEVKKCSKKRFKQLKRKYDDLVDRTASLAIAYSLLQKENAELQQRIADYDNSLRLLLLDAGQFTVPELVEVLKIMKKQLGSKQ